MTITTPSTTSTTGTAVSLQPVLAGALRAVEELRAAGEAIPLDADELGAATTVERIEELLQPLVLIQVTATADGFDALTQPGGPADLVQAGWRSYLVKVVNPTGAETAFRFGGGGSITSSPIASGMVARPYLPDQVEYEATIRDKWWAEFRLGGETTLSGLPLEYRVINVYSRDSGAKNAPVAFYPVDAELKSPRGNSVEQTQRFNRSMAGLRTVRLEFVASPSRDLTLEIRDADGRSCTAAVTVRDGFGRVYPARALRLAPDMYFHDHVYRSAGEPIRLPDGSFTVTASRGPEYLPVTTDVQVDAESGPLELRLQRWVDPAARGYYSGDPHIHGGGCSHYSLPTEGVTPETMIRHARGEGLWVSSVLTWGPCYYYQKQFFTGESISPAAELEHPTHQRAQGIDWAPQPTDLDAESLLHYDVEVSGFPSSHSGHVILLGLTDQDYPGTTVLEDWPSWNVPIHRWARAQGALTGYAHCGSGMDTPSFDLPNYDIPPFSGVGSNEFVVDVPLGVADFIAGAEVPIAWEANVWYHLLNVGYRPLMIGETDYPCMFDDRPGVGRTYVQLASPPTGGTAMRSWIDGLRENASYFGDGRSHVFDFAVDGTAGRIRSLAASGGVRVTASVAALLPEVRPESLVSGFSYDGSPYGWDLEWARVDGTRRVPVELVVNGRVADVREIEADGTEQQLAFDLELDRSSWIALRILPSVHTQPIVVEVAGAPVRASRRSADWLRDCVDKLWDVKHGFIREAEHADARAAYDEARAAYVRLAAECEAE